MSLYICHNCGDRCGIYGHVDLSTPFTQPDKYRCDKPDNLEEKLAAWKQWFIDNPEEV